MAYFIIIGTDNNVQTVVDEVRESHLQHNVVTSGCVVNQDASLFYHWDVFNAKGDKQGEGEKPSISLRDALTNQIAQFKTLLPDGAIPNVFLIGGCDTEEDANRIKYVYDSLCEIGGATLSGLSIDLVLIGYNLSLPDDVTLTPNWKNLRSIVGIENGRFPTDVLYINNMDYDGAATNVGAQLLGRFLSHWAKMVGGGDINPKQTVQTNHYAIGMAERQYNFEDLAPFFKLAAEERILDRALHDAPSAATQHMLDTKYYTQIRLDEPWIDGLCNIKSAWEAYCTYTFDYEKDKEVQPYALSVQQQQLQQYLNDWLKIYCLQQQRDIDALNEQIEALQQEISSIESNMPEEKVIDPESGEESISDEYKKAKKEISDKKKKIDVLESKIRDHEQNIANNTFADARLIKEDLGTGLLTDDQRSAYEKHLNEEKTIEEYLHKDLSVKIVNETIDRAIREEDSVPNFPADVINNVGRLKWIDFSPASPSTSTIIETPADTVPQEERSGCSGWFYKLFHRNDIISVEPSESQIESKDSSAKQTEQIKNLQKQVASAFKEYRKVQEVKSWWEKLASMVEQKSERQNQCRLDMDGVMLNQGSKHEKREGGYVVPFHRKSISIIDVNRARVYRDTDSYYLEQIAKLKERFFDSTIEPNKRQTMQELIKHQVIDAVRGIWHTLHWDGKNPFCNELFTNDDIHNFIEDAENGTHKQSKPFVEYVKLNTNNITQNINYLFYFSHPQIERQANVFREQYRIGEGTLTPVYLSDFTNALCEVQVMDVTDYIDNLADFRPRTEATLHESRIDYSKHVHEIVGLATGIEDKAKAIYHWLCNNIAYDTTYQIHDADRCWETKRGVCQAYCELFVLLAKQVGITAEIISGKSKSPNGKISDKDHAWIFVYTHGYDGIFIDPTWGAGSVQNGIFTASPNDTWFDVDPDWLIFTHYAEDAGWNSYASAKEVSYEQFEKLPFFEPQSDSGKDVLYAELSKISCKLN